MKGVVAMGILAVLLGGCGKAIPTEDTSALEDPPPKPPNCMNLPELKNLTLEDKTIADVIIINIGDTILYVPREWRPLSDIQAEKDEGIRLARKPIVSKYLLNYKRLPKNEYNYDYHYDECKGIVHVRRAVTFKFGDKVRRKFARNIDHGSDMSSLSVAVPDSLDFFADLSDKEEYLKYWSGVNRNSYSHYVRFNNDVYLVRNFFLPQTYGGPFVEATDEQRIESRDVMLALMNWVKTPPKDRNNDEVFLMGTRNDRER